jgi:hypothetical protein
MTCEYRRHSHFRQIAIPLFLLLLSISPVLCQAPAAGSTPLNNKRILGLMPDYQTVRDSSIAIAPMTVKQKWQLFFKESSDPFNLASAVVGATMSHLGRGVPNYGADKEAYGERVGAAFADVTTQSFFSDAVLASLFHEDPRYYRKGPAHGILYRIGYSMSRMVVTRTDSGHNTFNFSGVLGTMLGIALSNAYYPDRDINSSVTGGRFLSSFSGAATGNLLPEFWPDIRAKLFKGRRKGKSAP